MKSNLVLWLLTAVLSLESCAQGNKQNVAIKQTVNKAPNMDNKIADSLPQGDTTKITKTEEEWKKILSPDVFQVARLKGTERPFTSKFENFNEVGTYSCKACGNALFKSDTKFDAGCGWPSFYEPITKNSMLYEVDKTHGMTRTEVMCGKCKSHLGHVFDDGPPPTGLRYCMNGIVLEFKEKTK